MIHAVIALDIVIAFSTEQIRLIIAARITEISGLAITVMNVIVIITPILNPKTSGCLHVFEKKTVNIFIF